MNKPAPKEPSMDEILSSIRQIIADDDAAGAPRRPTIQAAPPPMEATPARPMTQKADRDLNDMLDDMEPLALSAEQIVGDKGGGFSFDSILADTEAADDDNDAADNVVQLIEPEDIAFAAESDDLPSFDPLPTRALEPEPTPSRAVQPDPAPTPLSPRRPEPEAVRPSAPQLSMADTAPMPDPTLSAEIAEGLLEPATQAAVRSSIGKLSAMGIGNPGLTLEAMMRDMLRPMLKEWLDENLPSVVERMVEKEISRISRGE